VNGTPTSLFDIGYTRVGVDDYWQQCDNTGHNFHNASGWAMLNLQRFPVLWSMIDYAHSQSVALDWYFNNCYCSEQHPPFFMNDTRFLRTYDMDGVKLDGCGSSHNISLWSDLINQTGRPMMIENCHNGPNYGTLDWCPMNFFRSSTDINTYFPKVIGVNLNSTRAYASYPDNAITRPGCWAYPDMLEVGNFKPSPQFKATVEAQDRSHFGAWCVVSSPLVLSFDLTNATTTNRVWPVITNTEAVAVNQNWAGHPGRLVSYSNTTIVYEVPPSHLIEVKDPESQELGLNVNSWQVWAKPQPNKKYAVLLLNMNGNVSQDITVEFADLPMPQTVSIRDIWNHRDLGEYTNSYTAHQVPPFDSSFLLLSDVSQ